MIDRGQCSLEIVVLWEATVRVGLKPIYLPNPNPNLNLNPNINTNQNPTSNRGPIHIHNHNHNHDDNHNLIPNQLASQVKPGQAESSMVTWVLPLLPHTIVTLNVL